MKPKDEAGLKTMQTKELNNGQLSLTLTPTLTPTLT